MTMEYKSNYEKVTEDWKKRFLDMDQERLIERFQLNHDGQWLYLRYLGQQPEAIAYIRKGSVCRQRRNTGI